MVDDRKSLVYADLKSVIHMDEDCTWDNFETLTSHLSQVAC